MPPRDDLYSEVFGEDQPQNKLVKITLYKLVDPSKKIAAIKRIRAVTKVATMNTHGLGLKESKKAVEKIESGHIGIIWVPEFAQSACELALQESFVTNNEAPQFDILYQY